MRAIILLIVAIGASGCYETYSYSPPASAYYNSAPYRPEVYVPPRNTFGDFLVYGPNTYIGDPAPRHYGYRPY